VAVKIKVRLFASYREAVGASQVELPLHDDADGAALWTALVARYPGLRTLPPPSGFAINDEYVTGNRPLRGAAEVALIPPVSGGDAGAVTVELTGGPISTDRVLRAVADPRAGAVVLFLGVVRDNARGRRVDHLVYEAYETLARREMAKIAAAVTERWPVTRIAIVHRTGRLGVGEPSVAVAVSAPHRGDAFDAGRYTIDTLKQTVPIWKKEVWEGGAAWIGAEHPAPAPKR
jgi:molybdopterin synthase catalytic subunit/molybdopterin converting factor small subunit